MMFKRLLVLCLLFIASSISSVSAIDESTKNILGNLAIIGEDYNIYSYNFAEDTLHQISDDASDTRHYQYPTWSTDGRLAYFCCDLFVADTIGAEVMISPDGISPAKLAYSNPNESIIYAYWSPADCGNGCRDLAMLTNNVVDGGLALEMLHDRGDETSSDTIAEGGPFYYHWNSTGTQMVFHRFGSQIEIYDVAENDIGATYELSSGTFQTPVWSAADDRILFAATNDTDDTFDLVLLESGEIRVLVPELTGNLAFLMSPDGRYVAYRNFTQMGLSGLIVVDVETGEEVANGQDVPAISFFWSPDSSKIAYITVEENRQSASMGRFLRSIPVQNDSPTEFTWMLLDVEANTNLSYSSFVPSFEGRYLLTYFDQFAPSHLIWSPDSRYIVYSDVNQVANEPYGLIKLIDTEQAKREPLVISEGFFAVWSFK